jgi:hypothetical protein
MTKAKVVLSNGNIEAFNEAISIIDNVIKKLNKIDDPGCSHSILYNINLDDVVYVEVFKTKEYRACRIYLKYLTIEANEKDIRISVFR